jgi:hypothetical protein
MLVIVNPPSALRTIVNSSVAFLTPIGVFDVLARVPASTGVGA